MIISLKNSLKAAAQLFVIASVLVAGLETASAKELRYKDMPIEFREGERLHIVGLRGSVRLVGTAPGKPAVLRARKWVADKATGQDLQEYEALSFNVRREGTSVIIESKLPQDKESLNKWLKGGPELHLELEAASLPAEIVLRDGQVTIEKWKNSASVGIVAGKVATSAGEGALRIQIQKGEVKVEKQKGDVAIDSNLAKLTAQEIEGDLDLANFGGESTIGKVEGHVNLRTYAGGTSLTKSKGSLDFQTGRGSLSLSGFEGPIRGQNDVGSVNATVEGDAEIAIESNQGTVTVSLPKDSGAGLRLATEEGNFSVPDSVRANLQGGAKIFVARLSGEGPKGMVQVKSKTGAIRVK